MLEPLRLDCAPPPPTCWYPTCSASARMKKLLIRVGIVGAIVAAIWLAHTLSSVHANARMTKLNTDIENLFAGLQEFKEHVGSYPTGSNAQIVKALRGQNPKNIIILVSRKTELNDRGEFVDTWGNPLRIYFSDTTVLVRSAGDNGRFENSSVPNCDDLFWSN